MNDAHHEQSRIPHPDSTEPGCDLSDSEAVEAVLGGDTEAFAHIVRRHEGLLYATIFRMLNNAEEAADVTQEAFLTAYTKLGMYNPRRPFRPWLFRIASNAAITRQRQANRRPSIALSEQLADNSPSPRHRAEVVELGEQIETAVGQLPADARELFDMRYRRDLSTKEIAQATGRKPNAVIVALHRLRGRLRAMIPGNHTKSNTRETHT